MKKIRLALILLCLTNVIVAKSIGSPVVVDTVLLDENVSYKVTQDERNLYLNISTSDEKTIMSILHFGVSVFFDVKGKKKQNVYIKYPLEPTPPIRKGNNEIREEPKGFEEEEKNRKLMIMNIIENDYSQKAEYGYFDESREFNILLNTLDVSIAFIYDENEGLFEYNLQLPKALINTDSKVDFEKLTIGVKTIKEERKQDKNGGLSGNLGGVSVGGQQSGGRRGGGQGGPPGGGQGGKRGGPPPSSGEKSKPADVVLNFWFKPNL